MERESGIWNLESLRIAEKNKKSSLDIRNRSHLCHAHPSDLDDVSVLQPKLKLCFATKLFSVSFLGPLPQSLHGNLNVLVRLGVDQLREDIDTVLEPGMVISMEPMLTLPEGQPGAGGYREHDILIIGDSGNENITGYPYGPQFNVVG